jgi:hypothetical protein
MSGSAFCDRSSLVAFCRKKPPLCSRVGGWSATKTNTSSFSGIRFEIGYTFVGEASQLPPHLLSCGSMATPSQLKAGKNCNRCRLRSCKLVKGDSSLPNHVVQILPDVALVGAVLGNQGLFRVLLKLHKKILDFLTHLAASWWQLSRDVCYSANRLGCSART